MRERVHRTMHDRAIAPLIDELERWGAVFLRVTSAGHRRYRLGTQYVDLAPSSSDWRGNRNMAAAVKRAVRVYRQAHPGAVPREVARREEQAMGEVNAAVETVEALVARPAEAHVPYATPRAEYGPWPAAHISGKTDAERAREGVSPPMEQTAAHENIVLTETAEGEMGKRRTKRETTMRTLAKLRGTYPCMEVGCGRVFALPMGLGRHLRQTHGVVRTPGAAVTAPRAAAAPTRTIAERAVAAVSLLVAENTDLRRQLEEVAAAMGLVSDARDKAREVLRRR